ncbi:agmatinase family protein [Cytobacillus solani]|uniref:Formimidoylglutamase n=1 Tax=Cytobacillus solani TaxID=1637975 RepID=A0A0Q3T252_9BACI|nr:agmatinase family protein [Cytobacillus solani]KOP79633.1 formimidoylglutamase [Bacillus sp. FJAT-21945]KQL17573.1 formimidoylglutamase [Cytobacillus solani]USK55434.1 agmatinase family protein [Cytobacillus solani]
MKKNWLQKPEWSWNQTEGQPTYVHHWVQPLDKFAESPDLILYGAPISRSSISVSGASLYPTEFRKMWKGYATYNLDEDIDLTSIRVGDAGDVAMHTTDILLSHRRIQESTQALAADYPNALTCMIGGDHSTTACAVRGVKDAHPEETIGILQLDTHLDVRDPAELGPANGTPIRQLIDGNAVKGENVINIGLHGYFNAKPLVDYAKEHKIQMVTLKQARKDGVVKTIQDALERLAKQVDRIYVTVDMDVLDISVAPGVPASTPGGLTAIELFDALLEIGKNTAVRHIDFVCLDPSKDTNVAETVKTGVYAWLQFVTGFACHSNQK